MKLTKCEHGHIYDGDKFAVCPYCTGKTEAEILGTTGEAAAQSVNVAAESEHTPVFLPVQGWLVAVAGPALGHDFRLTAGRNFVGAGTETEIDLSADESVSGEHLASIVYDPVSGGWFVHPCETKQLFYRNDEVVLAPVALAAGDRIRLGGTELLFVPFTGYDGQKGEANDAK